MKFTTVFLVLLALTATTFASPLTSAQYELLFSRFVQQYGKSYNGLDLISKYNTFVDNLNMIIKHNSGKSTWTMAMNEFGDMTAEEFSKSKTGLITAPSMDNATEFNASSVKVTADEVDWRNKGVVNPVKNQGQCGSCWAFSATSSLESRYAISKGKLYDLSEQQLVDCSGSTGNHGCNGGLMNYAYNYYLKSGGACETKDYPYTAKDGSCKKTCSPVLNVSGFQWITPRDESALLKAVSEGPVSIAVSAGNSAFQFYSSGILDNAACNQRLDHGVAAVGYGTENGVDYWIVRNSWGTTWGDKGHIRVVRGKNMCKVAEQPIFPTL